MNDVRSMDTRIADSLVAQRLAGIATLSFQIALLLIAVGTYGVLSYAVSRNAAVRLGVRMAIQVRGRVRIRGQFLALAARLLAIGTALGIVGAWLTGRAMQTLLFQVPLHVATTA